MSSTNRSTARENHVADYYVTPIIEIENFIEEFLKVEPNALRGNILDPCAGGDEHTPISYPTALAKYTEKDKIYSFDIREDSPAYVIVDYLQYEQAEPWFDLIITNPPFNIAQQVIEKALKDVREGGFVVMLLRLNYFDSKARKAFWDSNRPKYSFVHHKRMSFTKDGKTDSIEYQHLVWQKGYHPDFTLIKVI